MGRQNQIEWENFKQLFNTNTNETSECSHATISSRHETSWYQNITCKFEQFKVCEIFFFLSFFFQKYLFGIPIGLSLNIPQEDISHILEEHNSLEVIASQLGRLAYDLCKAKYPEYQYKSLIVRDLMQILLTKNVSIDWKDLLWLNLLTFSFTI